MELSKSSIALANSDEPLHTLLRGCLRESFEAYKLLPTKITHVTFLLAELLSLHDELLQKELFLEARERKVRIWSQDMKQ